MSLLCDKRSANYEVINFKIKTCAFHLLTSVNVTEGQSTEPDRSPTMMSMLNTFHCATNDELIPVSFVCDFIQHCPDNSDEDSCGMYLHVAL